MNQPCVTVRKIRNKISTCTFGDRILCSSLSLFPFLLLFCCPCCAVWTQICSSLTWTFRCLIFMCSSMPSWIHCIDTEYEKSCLVHKQLDPKPTGSLFIDFKGFCIRPQQGTNFATSVTVALHTTQKITFTVPTSEAECPAWHNGLLVITYWNHGNWCRGHRANCLGSQASVYSLYLCKDKCVKQQAGWKSLVPTRKLPSTAELKNELRWINGVLSIFIIWLQYLWYWFFLKAPGSGIHAIR